MSDGAQITLAIIGALTLPLQAFVTFMINARLNRQKEAIIATSVAVNAVTSEVKVVSEAVAATGKDMATLKEQTNHIKDALVAVTEKEAHARGISEGRELPSIHQTGPVGPAGEKGDTGDTGKQGEKGDTGGTVDSKSKPTTAETITDTVLDKLEQGASIKPLKP